MLVVGNRPLKMADGSTRLPGQPVPEARQWPNPGPWVRTGRLLERPAFETLDLLDLIGTDRLADLAKRRGVKEPPADRDALIAALLMATEGELPKALTERMAKPQAKQAEPAKKGPKPEAPKTAA